MPEPEKEQEQFKIDNDDKACWAFKKIKKLEEEIAKKEEVAESQIRQVETWLKDEKEKRERKIDNFKTMLVEYADQLKEDEPDMKTHSLPFGKIQFRKQRPKWKYDNKKLLEDAKKRMGPKPLNSLIKVKEKVDKRKLKKEIKEGPFKILKGKGQVVNTETGEVLEGIEVKERGERLKIKTT
jgi:hypothetical protein